MDKRRGPPSEVSRPRAETNSRLARARIGSMAICTCNAVKSAVQFQRSGPAELNIVVCLSCQAAHLLFVLLGRRRGGLGPLLHLRSLRLRGAGAVGGECRGGHRPAGALNLSLPLGLHNFLHLLLLLLPQRCQVQLHLRRMSYREDMRNFRLNLLSFRFVLLHFLISVTIRFRLLGRWSGNLADISVKCLFLPVITLCSTPTFCNFVFVAITAILFGIIFPTKKYSLGYLRS